MKIKILYEDNHLLVVEKPINIPVMADSSQDEDLLTILKADLKKRYNKPNEAYLGLVHRLDRPVGGVMVFAKTSKAANRLSEQIAKHKWCKKYLAITTQTILASQGTLKDKLLKDHKTNMVKVSDKGKEAILDYEILKSSNDLSLVAIELKTGRSHQIRVQFASRKAPLWGDQRYNSKARIGQQIALWSYQLTLVHPTTNKEMTFTSYPPDKMPWLIFQEHYPK